MPIYEYKCQSCGEQFELMQKFSDPPASHCVSCGAEGVKKLVSNTSFQLKGSGWYVTDYGKGGSGGKASGASEAKSGGENKPAEGKPAEGKQTESKPAESKPTESKPTES